MTDPPTEIQVKGRRGASAKRLNGTYKLRKQLVGKRPSYIKVQSDTADKMVIWFWSSNKVWMMTRKTMINTDSAYACVQDNASEPTKVTEPWKVYDKSVSKHEPDPNMVVVAIDEDNMTKLRQEKKDLEDQIENMRQKIDGLEIQMGESDRKIDALRSHVDESEHQKSVLVESHRRLKRSHDHMREQLANKIAEVKSRKADAKKKMAQEKTILGRRPQFAALEKLTTDPSFDPDTFRECIFQLIQTEGVDSTLERCSTSEIFCKTLADAL